MDTPKAKAENPIIATSPIAPTSTTNGKMTKAKAERMTSNQSLISLIDNAPVHVGDIKRHRVNDVSTLERRRAARRRFARGDLYSRLGNVIETRCQSSIRSRVEHCS